MRNLKDYFVFRPWERHSLVLMVGGLVNVFYGFSLVTLIEVTAEQEVVWEVALNVAPITFWGWVTVGTGFLAMLSSRWPEFNEAWGYIVLTGLSSGWAGVYLLGVVLGDAPSRALTSSLLWFLQAFLWWSVSGLINPERRRRVRKRGPD